MNNKTVLEVNNLIINLNKGKQEFVNIINNISFSVKKGECLGILGESGSGKSLTVKAILGILDKSFEVDGEIIYENKNLLTESKETLRNYRGKKIAMIMQNPMVCFDPLYRIEYQIAETWLAHGFLSKEEILDKSLKLLEKMKILNGEDVLKKYPHQLSGGMLQRIMIGIAISMEPDILIADEPTTAIDAITQYEILKELKQIKECGNMAMIFITHDLNVISKIADNIIVMNNGQIVASGDSDYILTGSTDEYTNKLVRSNKEFMSAYNKILDTGGNCG